MRDMSLARHGQEQWTLLRGASPHQGEVNSPVNDMAATPGRSQR